MYTYVLVGAGAIGGTVGARLARDGHSVLLCDASREHVDALNADGIRITGPVEELTAHVPAVTPDELPDRLERVILAVKAQHTADALAEIAPRLAQDGLVLSLQNGLNEPAIADAIGQERTIGGFVNFSADYVAPGEILLGNHGAFFIGEIDGHPSARVEKLLADLEHSVATDNIFGYLWSKLAYSAILAGTAVSDLTISEALDEPAYRPLFLGLGREVLGAATARPESFDGFDPDDVEGSIQHIADFHRASGKARTGIYRDLVVRKRPTEVEALMGSIDTPLLTRTRELIRDIEHGTRPCDRATLDLLASAAG